MNNLVYIGTFTGFDLYTRNFGKKLSYYLVPVRLCDYELDKYKLSLYRISSSLALEILNSQKHYN